ncbi:DEAD/DEAH box helicase family protein, partial [candidate division WOR-3 bacterium]|nr:DEAD/DEAH box helicase family protein [candidate division WOR-3 bacterium]
MRFVSRGNPLTEKNIFGLCRFKFVWRTYQKRVLDELQEHLEDDSLHVVAAPGSGKTVLGIETVIRLGKPALILSPTLTIRDQWTERFKELFLKNPGEADGIVSKDLFVPKPLTSVTYQSLHSFVGENKGKKYSEKYFEVLVLDEAHHLRTSWWKSLVYFKEKMGKCRIIALTATPPYDVTFSEWERYTGLCGPIDSEISVPELVKTGDLCFHRDYIFLSKPDKNQIKTLFEQRKKIREFIEKIQRDEKFAGLVASHPWIADFEKNMPESLSAPVHLTSMLAFLEKHRTLCPYSCINTKSEAKILTGGKNSLPGFDIYWLENLLNFVFFCDPRDHFLISEDVVELKKELEREGAIEKRKIFLANNPNIKKMLVKNPGKLSSIAEIVQRESAGLGDKLRMVVLTDFICPTYLPKSKQDLPELLKIGVVPIFEILRRKGEIGLKAGILCGKIVIVPKTAASALVSRLEEAGDKDAGSKIKLLKFDDRFVELKLDGKVKELAVRAVTCIFTDGYLNILVGTKSLLGEGWDAPCINSLVLASYVGSYMMSNQMRGRAIRIFRESPGKTANIWHLACVDPTAEDFGEDYTTLERRFLSFTGVALDSPLIRNGIRRMALDSFDISKEGLDEYNAFSLKKAMDRKSLERDWMEALERGSGIEEGLSLKKDSIKVLSPKTFILADTIKALLFQGLGIGAFVFFNIIRNLSFSGK